MKRLRAHDASFFYSETPATPMHAAYMTLVDPSEAPSGVRWGYEQVRELIESRLHLLPQFRQRVEQVPLGLDYPAWVDDEHFHLEFHLRRTSIAQPGDARALTETVERLVSLPLDRHRPLWELYYIDGLITGEIALLSKVHHCMLNEGQGSEVVSLLLDLDSNEPNLPVPIRPWQPRKSVTRERLLKDALQKRLLSPKANMRRFWGAAQRRRETDRQARLAGTAPRTFFNTKVSARRRLSFGELPLKRIRLIKQAYNVKFNDVWLALVGGAVRDYLAEQNELPDRALVALVPISVTVDGQDKVISVRCSLANDIEDPIERVQAISTSMAAAVERHAPVSATRLQDWTEFSAPAVMSMATKLYSRMHIADYARPSYNLPVTNVPGPNKPLYCAGVPVRSIYSIGTVVHGAGLSFTVQSYVGRMFVSMQGCAELFPNIDHLWDLFSQQLDELERALPPEVSAAS